MTSAALPEAAACGIFPRANLEQRPANWSTAAVTHPPRDLLCGTTHVVACMAATPSWRSRGCPASTRSDGTPCGRKMEVVSRASLSPRRRQRASSHPAVSSTAATPWPSCGLIQGSSHRSLVPFVRPSCGLVHGNTLTAASATTHPSPSSKRVDPQPVRRTLPTAVKPAASKAVVFLDVGESAAVAWLCPQQRTSCRPAASSMVTPCGHLQHFIGNVPTVVEWAISLEHPSPSHFLRTAAAQWPSRCLFHR